MTDESENPEKKLIIDEDWKSQVEAEKEAVSQGAAPASEEAKPNPMADDVPLPQADFLFLVGTLYLQGAMALGLMPNPISGKAEVKLNQAKHAIDLLAMLQEKTKGNLESEEAEELDAALHQLRMAYVGVSNRQNSSAS